MSDSSVSPVISESRLIGRVKWFNNKSGFGFITLYEGENKDKDIFVHYSCINAESAQYKYLVQGEYVEFDLIKSENENHEFHASNVTGIKGGILMCETYSMNNAVPVRPYVRPRRVYNGPRDRKPPVDNQEVVEEQETKQEGFTEVKKRVSRKRPTSTRP